MVLSLISRSNLRNEIPVTGIAPDSVTIDEEIGEQYSLSCEVILSQMNEAAAPLLQMENYIRVSSNGQLYRIKGVTGRSRRRTAIKTVTADHVFFDIIGVKQDKSTAINESATFQRVMNYALNGTGWTWQLAPGVTFNALTFENFRGNALDLFKRLQDRYEFEWYPDSRTMTVYIYKQLGTETEAQFRYNHNIISVTDKTTTTDIVNVRKGYGKKRTFTEDDPEPPVLKDSDYLCVAVWRNEESIAVYGERWGDDYENENYTIVENLRNYLESISNPFPILSLTLSYAVLAEYGENISDETIDLGNSVYVIHEPQGIDVKARILKRKLYPESRRKSTEITLASVKVTSVTQNTRTRQEIAALRAETTRELSRIGSINQGQTELATNFEQLARQVQTLFSNLGTVSQNVINLSTQVDGLSTSLNDTNASVESIGRRVDTANDTAQRATTTANNAISATNRLTTTINTIQTKTTNSIAVPDTFTGSIRYVDTGAEIHLKAEISGLGVFTFELPQTPVMGDFKGLGVMLDADDANDRLAPFKVTGTTFEPLATSDVISDILYYNIVYRY